MVHAKQDPSKDVETVQFTVLTLKMLNNSTLLVTPKSLDDS